MSKQPNVVEKVIGWIPGYKGYAQREARRDSDKLLREAVLRALDEPRNAVDAAIASASRAMSFDHLEGLEGLRRRLSTMVDRLRHAPQAYSGFFDSVKIDATQLDAIHDHDSRLNEHAGRISMSAAGLAAPSADRIASVNASIDDLEKALRRRDDLVKGEE